MKSKIGTLLGIFALAEGMASSLPRPSITKGTMPESTANRTHLQTVKRKKLRRIVAKSRAINRMVAIFIIVLSCLNLNAQKAVKQSDGNYHAVLDTAKIPAGMSFIDKDGKTYPLYITKSKKLYYMRISKTGKVIKSYLKQ